MGAEAWFCFKTFSGSLSLYHSLPASPRVRLVFCTERPGKDHRPRAPVPELFARKEDLYKPEVHGLAVQCQWTSVDPVEFVAVAGLSFSPATSGPHLGECTCCGNVSRNAIFIVLVLVGRGPVRKALR